MAVEVSPLAVFDPFNRLHIVPHVGGYIRTQTESNPRAVNPNPLIIASSFRSGKPKILTRFRELEALENRHDPDGNRDQGVALARMSRIGFADADIFGAADLYTYRLNQATAAIAHIVASAVQLIKVTTGDFGWHVNGAQGGSRLRLTAGTHAGKKVRLFDPVRSFTLDDLGPLFTLAYTGNGTGPTVTVRRRYGTIAYTATQPNDADKITVNGGAAAVDGKVFEFESAGGVTGSNIAV